jgi:hypothetical protein
LHCKVQASNVFLLISFLVFYTYYMRLLLPYILFYGLISGAGLPSFLLGQTLYPIGTHADHYAVGQISPNVAYSFSLLRKINVPDPQRPWNLTVEGNARTDTNGWPLEDFQILFFDHRPFNAWANNNTGPTDDPSKKTPFLAGVYSLSFEGSAQIYSWCDNPGFRVLEQKYDSLNNVTTAKLDWPVGQGPNGPYAFMLLNFYRTRSTPTSPLGSGVKNIRLIRPGFNPNTAQLYRIEWLNAFSPFSAIRFMTFTATNNFGPSSYLSPQTHLPNGNRTEWSDRQSPKRYPYSQGAPWESVAQVANLTGRDIWINIPHAATDDYVRKLAQLLYQKLNPQIRVYIEYSNEVWNPDFTQHQYNKEFTDFAPEAETIRQSATIGGSYWSSIAQPRRVAARLLQISRIFEEVFGVTIASRTRLRPVFAWAVGFDYGRQRYADVLQWIARVYGPPKNFIYGIASGAYFNDRLPEDGSIASGTPQEVLAVMQRNSDALLPALTELSGYARQYEIAHLQYEGGPDNGGGQTYNLANRIVANRIPEMKQVMLRHYQRNWRDTLFNPHAQVNELANHFVLLSPYNRYGCWGAIEDLAELEQPTLPPKYDALQTLIGDKFSRPQCRWLSPTAPPTKVFPQETIPLALEATDINGIARVAFFEGATLIALDSTPPFQAEWRAEKPGFYAISAKAITPFGYYTFAPIIDIEAIDFFVSPTLLELSAEAQETTLTVRSGLHWSFSANAPWYTPIYRPDSRPEILTLAITENPFAWSREDTLVFEVEGIKRKVLVKQNGASALIGATPAHNNNCQIELRPIASKRIELYNPQAMPLQALGYNLAGQCVAQMRIEPGQKIGVDLPANGLYIWQSSAAGCKAWRKSILQE